MYGNNDHIPVHHVPVTHQNRKPMKRHHTAHYYMQRVQDSLTTQVSKVVCSIFLALLAIVGLVAFITWLSLRPHRPRFYIQEFNMPDLAQPNGFQNAHITFNLTARNSNLNIRVYYESMDGAVFYRQQKLGFTPLPSPFIQQPKTTRVLNGVLSGSTLTVTSQSWLEFQNDRADGNVEFVLELTSVIRFKIATWETKRHTLHATCTLGVGPDGSLLSNYRDKRCPVYFS